MPLNLLSPWYLLVGLAVVFPVLIHLLQRKKEVTIDFPMVRFVALAKRRSSRRLKLKNILLLLLRMAAILLLAFILARPVLHSPADVYRREKPGQTAVILDNSLSMSLRTGGEAKFEAARELAAGIIAQAPEGELFTLVPVAAGTAGSISRWMGREDFLADLSEAAVIPATGDFTSAFERAYALFKRGATKDRRIVVITDLARGGWDTFSMLSVEKVDPGIAVRLFVLGHEPPGNQAGILSVEVRSDGIAAGEVIDVSAAVVHYGKEDSLPVELWWDGRLLDRRFADIPSGGQGEVAFTVRPEEGGAHRGELRLEPDLYRADDNRYFGRALSPPVAALLVDGDPRPSLVENETFFLQEALRPERLARLSPIEVTVLDEEAFSTLDGTDYQVAILANLASPPITADLPSFVSAGGGLVLFWGGRAVPEDYQRSLGGLLPARIVGSEEALPGAAFTIGETDYTDSLLSLFRPPRGGTFETASFSERAKLGPLTDDAKVLASFSDGEPWLVSRRIGEGMLLFFASTADLEWNDLATKPVFVPLIQRMVMAVTGNLGSEGVEDIVSGEPKIIQGESEEAFTSLAVMTPGGEVREVEYRSGEDGVQAVFRETDTVGFYTYDAGGREEIFAVNVPAAESDLRLLDEEGLKSRFPTVPLEVVTVSGKTRMEDFSQAGARSISRHLFIALFILLLLEMVVAGPRRIGFLQRKAPES